MMSGLKNSSSPMATIVEYVLAPMLWIIYPARFDSNSAILTLTVSSLVWLRLVLLQVIPILILFP